MRPLLLLPLAFWPALLLAATLRVGPGEALTRIADAARVARDGDVVLIMAGEYRGDVAVWPQRRLTIRGEGGRPVLIASGQSAEGKAIWVVRNGDFVVENIEFRGTRVSGGNGAGIRFEGGRLEIRNCRFVDNQMGLLTGHAADAALVIRDSVFAHAPPPGASLPHLLYVGRIARFELSGSRFHGGNEGHLVKSRARVNDIRYNLIDDGPGGKASYELEFPNGGVAQVVGNVIGQSATTRNPVLVAYGAEGYIWPENRLALAHNTLVSRPGAAAWFLRVWPPAFGPAVALRAVNNLIVGNGLFAPGGGEAQGNFAVAATMLGTFDVRDYTLGASAALRGRVTPLAADDPLRPTAEFAPPVGTRPVVPTGRWAPGAFQSDPVVERARTPGPSPAAPAPASALQHDSLK